MSVGVQSPWVRLADTWDRELSLFCDCLASMDDWTCEWSAQSEASESHRLS